MIKRQSHDAILNVNFRRKISGIDYFIFSQPWNEIFLLLFFIFKIGIVIMLTLNTGLMFDIGTRSTSMLFYYHKININTDKIFDLTRAFILMLVIVSGYKT